MTKNLATCIGLCAILLWASIIAFIKKVSLFWGADLALLFIYSVSTIILLIIFGLPDFKKIPKGFLVFTTILFTAFEFCLSYAVALTQTERQAIEVSVLNYLWPSFTIIALMMVKEFKLNIFIFFGVTISILSVFYILTNGQWQNFNIMLHNMMDNPIVYILALSAASIWAWYCVVVRKFKIHENPIAFYFLVISILLWLKFFLISDGQSQLQNFSMEALVYVLIAAFALGMGYASWNIGIVHGNISLLVASSYFTPIISSLFAVFMLNIALPETFWTGVIAISIGSFICWMGSNLNLIEPRIRKWLSTVKSAF